MIDDKKIKELYWTRLYSYTTYANPIIETKDFELIGYSKEDAKKAHEIMVKESEKPIDWEYLHDILSIGV